MRKFAPWALGLVASLAIGTAVYASVTFDPDTGEGFVGKGDVQIALGGLNNAQLQSLANTEDGIVFTYEDSVTYSVPCTKDTAHSTLTQTFDRSTSVASDVAYTTRTNVIQVTGFVLEGFLDTVVSGSPQCPTGWDADGAPIETGSTGGVLYVNGVPLN